MIHPQSKLLLFLILMLSLPLSSLVNGQDKRQGNNRIAFVSNRDGNYEIYSMLTDGNDVQRLTNNDGLDLDPDWSPDGTKIAFTSYGDIESDIFIMNADGSNLFNLTQDPLNNDRYPSWSSDGTRIAFSRSNGGLSSDIYVVNIDGSGLTKIVDGGGETYNYMPTWSPDGYEIMFTSAEEIPRVGYSGAYTEKVNADGTSRTRLGLGGINTYGNLDWSWSIDRIAYFDADTSMKIYAMDRDITNISAVTSVPQNENQSHKNPSWSSDGAKIVYEGRIVNQPTVNSDSDIYIVDVATQESINITPDSYSEDIQPDWQP